MPKPKRMSTTTTSSYWFSTTGEVVLEPCEVVTHDQGLTFYCRTHRSICVWDEGWVCREKQ